MSTNSGRDQLLHKLELAEQRGLPAEEEECVVLFADIVGYSTYANRRGDAEALELVRRFEGAARGLIGSTGGQVVMTAGDAIMACWGPQAGLVQALRAAQGMLDNLREDNEGRRHAEHIRVRVGVHCGKVMRLQDGDLIGNAVNLACRIQTAALPDEILVSADAVKVGQGQDGMPACRRLGRMRLKGMGAPVEVYSVEQAAGRGVGRALQQALARGASPMRWPVGSWVLFAIGLLFVAGALASGEFERPGATAAVLGLWFVGWSVLWAAYQPRTVSMWRPVVRIALLAAWLVLVTAPLGRALGVW